MRSGFVSAAVAVLAASVIAGCTSGSAHTAAGTGPSAPTSTTPAPVSSTAAPTTRAGSPRPTPPRTTRATHSPSPTRSAAPTHAPVVTSSGKHPVIVIDPGHSVSIHATDPATGLDVSDYENEPEMRDVYAVALLVRSSLQARGYHVIMTKTSLDQPVSLGQRAAIARDAHAALAISIHDQAGSNGGIGFRSGNNTVYYQSVGTYRSAASGRRTYFSDAALAATSRRYGIAFAAARQRVEGTSIRLQGSTGYDLGGRGLAGGDIWMVQLLSHVPWIYNESGGNSAGQVGLDAADRATYADALVAGVERCIPPPH